LAFFGRYKSQEGRILSKNAGIRKEIYPEIKKPKKHAVIDNWQRRLQ